jgi:arylsulfatase A-like enzyme
MPAPHLLIVTIDGLRASALGAYGNTTFPTPALDAFAADSFLLDTCYAPSVDLAEDYRALWHAIHPHRTQVSSGVAPSLPRLLKDLGYAATLVTDEPLLASEAAASEFDRCVQIAELSNDEPIANRAEDSSQTALARVFAAASEVIAAESESASLVWIHARGMYGPWDAPLELQTSLLDEGDPPPVETVSPPDVSFGETDDPDAAFRYSCAYAAQVMVLDDCWKGLVEAIAASGADQPWLIMLLGTRGYPLGEHRRIGGVDPRLYREQLHVPWLVRFPNGSGRMARSGRLTSLFDVLPTLLDCVGGTPSEGTGTSDGASVLPLITSRAAAWRDALVCASALGPRAIRTDDWCFRQDEVTREHGELFVRPDDRWEANDVAKLCSEVTERLGREMDEYLKRLLQG